MARAATDPLRDVLEAIAAIRTYTRKGKREFEHDYRASRPISCSRELHPQMQTFAQWLARNKARIPVQPRSMRAA